MKEFDDIRPYYDNEINAATASLLKDKGFISLFDKLYPQPDVREQVLQILASVKSTDEFQKKVILPLLDYVEKTTTKGISFSTMDQFRTDGNYLFISNHRDIILDSALLNMILFKHEIKRTEIAIGDNLLIYNWIKELVRINRSFIVKRNLGLREQLDASKELSAYIRNSIAIKGNSVWLAQREGRTKDGNDLTQPAVLKMLNMSNSGSVLEGFIELNIVPMAISYEIEPCGIAKVAELLNRKYNPDFAKTQQDDLNSMANGFMAQKGRIHYAFGNPVNFKLVDLIKDKKPNEAIQAISEYIDKRIYFNYKLWPNNYIAYDLREKSAAHADKYTVEEKNRFVEMMETEVSTLKFDKEEATGLYLNMYANPVQNYEKHFA